MSVVPVYRERRGCRSMHDKGSRWHERRWHSRSGGTCSKRFADASRAMTHAGTIRTSRLPRYLPMDRRTCGFIRRRLRLRPQSRASALLPAYGVSLVRRREPQTPLSEKCDNYGGELTARERLDMLRLPIGGPLESLTARAALAAAHARQRPKTRRLHGLFRALLLRFSILAISSLFTIGHSGSLRLLQGIVGVHA